MALLALAYIKSAAVAALLRIYSSDILNAEGKKKPKKNK